MKSRLLNINVRELEKALYRECCINGYYKNDNASREDLASRLGVSPEQLSEYLNSHRNISFSAYLNALRINEGKRLLREKKEFNAARVGFEAGFRSTSAWHKAFKDATGISPEEFRKK